MVTTKVHQNAVNPYALRYIVTSSDATLDLNTIASATFVFQRETGSTGSWDAVLTGASTTSLTVTHVYQSGDLPNLETIHVVPHLVLTGGGVVVCEAGAIRVVSEFI